MHRAPIISFAPSRRPADPNLVDLSSADMAFGKISEQVYIRPLYTYAVDEHEIRRRLGGIKPEKLAAIASIITRKLTDA